MGSLLERRNALILIGGVLALVAGVALAMFLGRSAPEERAPPPASRGGLIVEAGPTDERVDPTRALRCFVGGQFVGEMSLADCAKRNGVATDALDVGVDQSGALAAAGQAGTVLTPLPPMGEATAAPLTSAAAPQAAAGPAAPPAATGPAAPCWRYGPSGWRKFPADMTRAACVDALFAGRCERPGSATYGRWGQQTLRLVPGRVEVSSDNRTFGLLVSQGPGCSVPPVG